MNAELEGDHTQHGPGADEPAGSARHDGGAGDGAPADRFYQGVVVQVDWGLESGVVRSVTGREIPFEFPFVTVMGNYRRVESLRAGMRVGFDVGWTSRGLRVTTLKVYE